MRITREHYRDFIGALSKKIAEIEGNMTEYHDERGVVDEEDWREYNELWKESNYLESVQKILREETRWAEFESLDALEVYVDNIDICFQSLDSYSKSVLPKDGGELVGATQAEWDRIESMRYELRWTWNAWNTFADFCEYGRIV